MDDTTELLSSLNKQRNIDRFKGAASKRGVVVRFQMEEKWEVGGLRGHMNKEEVKQREESITGTGSLSRETETETETQRCVHSTNTAQSPSAPRLMIGNSRRVRTLEQSIQHDIPGSRVSEIRSWTIVHR